MQHPCKQLSGQKVLFERPTIHPFLHHQTFSVRWWFCRQKLRKCDSRHVYTLYTIQVTYFGGSKQLLGKCSQVEDTWSLFAKGLPFFWGGSWIFITFMGLLSLKVGTWTPKNLGRSLTLYMVIAMIQTTPGTPNPPFRKKEEVLILELPHIALLTHPQLYGGWKYYEVRY